MTHELTRGWLKSFASAALSVTELQAVTESMTNLGYQGSGYAGLITARPVYAVLEVSEDGGESKTVLVGRGASGEWALVAYEPSEAPDV